MSIRSVAVLGAGNGGLAAAADLTRRGFEARLFARSDDRLAPIRANGGITTRGVFEDRVMPDTLTTDIGVAVDGADLVMLVVPAHAHAFYAGALADRLRPGVPVFLNPGHTGGGLHFLAELARAGRRAPLETCETVTLTYITRIEAPATVAIYSYTRELMFAAIPGSATARLHALLAPLYPELRPASSVLETGLANINAIFHPSGMLMNAGWIEATGGNFLFYREGITASVGRVVSQVDAERLAVAEALGVPAVPFLELFQRAGLTTRAAVDSGSISVACRESAPNATIRSPSTLDHRYVHEDVGYGLVPISAFGRLGRVPTPTIDSHIQIFSAATGIPFAHTGLTRRRMGIDGLDAEALRRLVDDGQDVRC